jgi:type I restriction enzyme S subunit
MKWPVVSLGVVADINPRNKEWSVFPDDTDVTFVPMSAVSEFTASISKPEVRPLGQVRRGYTPFSEGDLLFAKITPCMENGKAALAAGLLNGLGFGSTEFHVLRPRPVILPQYLLYFMRQQNFRNVAKQRMQGAVGQQRVPENFLRTFPIPLPSLSEQRRIVEILDQADALRKKRTEADIKADRILPTLFYKMFGDPATNLKGWQKGQLHSVIIEAQYGTSVRANAEGRGTAVVRMNNIDPLGHMDLQDLKHIVLDTQELEKYTLKPGDLLFNRTNSRELVGKTGLWRDAFEAVPASYLIRVRVNRKLVFPEYIWAYMNTAFIKQVLFEKARRAIGMANINAQELRALPVIIPDFETQRVFNRLLSSIECLRESRSRARTKIEQLFQTLLHLAFSGDLTATWRQDHIKGLLTEIKEQAESLAVQETLSQQENTTLQGSLF